MKISTIVHSLNFKQLPIKKKDDKRLTFWRKVQAMLYPPQLNAYNFFHEIE